MIVFRRTLLVLGLAGAGVPAHAAELPWVARSNVNAQLLLLVHAKYGPEDASQTGVEGYDEAITDLSQDTFDNHIADLKSTAAELRLRASREPDPRVRQDLEILTGAAENEVSELSLDRKYFLPFVDLDQFVFGVVRETIDPRVPLARQQTLAVRLEKYAGMAAGFRPITELAKERTQERLQAGGDLLGPYRGSVEQVLHDHAVLVAGIKDLLAKSGIRDWQASFARLAGQLDDYDEWVRVQILPKARADHRLPPEVYADRLRKFGVDMPVEELMARALASFAELRNQMNITAGQLARERGFADPDYRAVIRRMKQERIPQDRLLPLYQERLVQIEAAIRANHIVTLPERKASIRVATPAENAQVPVPHMSPPRLIGNTGEYGEFVIATGLPPDASGKGLQFDDFSHEGESWTLTAHESRPGHELQYARIVELGVSIARAVFADNPVNVEGWGLYAESEMQPYEPLDGQLFAEQNRAMRAARAFLDPMVNLGQIEPADIKTFLMEELGLSEALATSEMNRYTFRQPGQATAYFCGYMRLMETRQAAQLALRGGFDRQAFNDFVLAQGLLPPRLLRKAVTDDFLPAHRKR